jgi:hypothetical protein
MTCRLPDLHPAACWLPLLVALGSLSIGSHPVRGQDAPGPGTGAPRDADSARVVLDALEAYTGVWRSEEKSTPRRHPFHFRYQLEWLDPDRTVAWMVIERIAASGDVTEVFRGAKGREPGGEGVYYWAVSPSGRASRGSVRVEGNRVVTLYSGWTAAGDVVQIRDVFTPVTDGIFTSRTYLRNDPGAEWRQIGEDRWRVVSEGD